MIATHTSTRPEAMIPSASLATDFDEWMARWTFRFNGARYTGKPIVALEAMPSDGWRSFKREPRRAPSVESQLSPRLQFIASITRPKNRSPTRSSPGHARDSSDSSFDSIFSARPVTKQIPLFKNEFLEVRKSPKGGYGAFSIKDIEVGTVVMSEEPTFRASDGEVHCQYEGLTTEQRAEYRSLHGWAALEDDPILSIFKTNRFEISGHRCGIFLKSSRFNHACHPHATCTYLWNEIEGRMVFTAINPMKEGDEMTIQYTSNPSRLHDDYGFYCDCPSCLDPKNAAEIDRRCRSSH